MVFPHAVLGRVSLATTAEKRKHTAEGPPDLSLRKPILDYKPSLSAVSLGSWNLLVTDRIPVVQKWTGPVSASRERGVVRKAPGGGVLPGSARAQCRTLEAVGVLCAASHLGDRGGGLSFQIPRKVVPAIPSH